MQLNTRLTQANTMFTSKLPECPMHLSFPNLWFDRLSYMSPQHTGNSTNLLQPTESLPVAAPKAFSKYT